MPYLKVKPDTYQLLQKQIYDFPTCQFCGCEDFRLQKYKQSKANNFRLKQKGFGTGTLWKRTCEDCGQTTALVKNHLS